jgi:short-subunit dehydrogenase
MLIEGSVALVTGGSSGIGAATATALARRGANVLVHGRDAVATAAVADRVGGTPLVADLADPAAVDRLAATAEAAGPVDILVANAGIGWAGRFEAMGAADIERLVAVNLTGPIRLTHALLPGMRARGRGFLGYVTSIAGRTGVPGEAVYAATKAGLDLFAESLRLELYRTGIGVGVLVPGVVATPFFERRGRPYDRSRPRPLPVTGVAEALVAMVAAGGAEVYRPRWLRLPVAIRATLPGAYRGLAARFGTSPEHAG